MKLVNVKLSAGIVKTRGITFWAWSHELKKMGYIDWVFNVIPRHLGFCIWLIWELGGDDSWIHRGV